MNRKQLIDKIDKYYESESVYDKYGSQIEEILDAHHANPDDSGDEGFYSTMSIDDLTKSLEEIEELVGKSRVLAIQFDVEVPDGVYAEEVISFFNDALADSIVQGFHIAGADFVEDLTDVYEKQYPDLLVYR